jgi:hypothetical protein
MNLAPWISTWITLFIGGLSLEQLSKHCLRVVSTLFLSVIFTYCIFSLTGWRFYEIVVGNLVQELTLEEFSGSIRDVLTDCWIM